MDNQRKSLCLQAKSGDREAACELLRICYPDVFAYLRRLCGSRQDAEDLTQQTFVKVWSSLNSFAGRSAFSTWLYRIAHNTFIDWKRSNADSVQSHSDQWWQECVDHNPGPFANIAERQLAMWLYEVVEQLDEDKRYAVHLHYYEGLSLRETARVLGIATSTLKYRLREVFKTFRKKICLDENEIDRKAIPVPEGKKT